MNDKNEHMNSVSIIIVTQTGDLLLQHRDNIDKIEYPDHWGFIGGWIEENETPEIAVTREIKEEIYLNNASYLKLKYLDFLYVCEREDRPWSEYVFYAELNNKESSVLINEGQAIGVFTIEQCLSVVKLAPHHKNHLRHLIAKKEQIHKIGIKFDKLKIKNEGIMSKVKDYLELTKLGNVKDYQALEVGDGYMLSSENHPVGVIHTKEDAKIIALLVFAKDIPRGNHYHHDKIEYMTVLSGKLKCEFSLPDSPKDIYDIILEEGQQIRILPGCVHTYTALESDVYALEYAPHKYKGSDVVILD